MTAKPEGGGTWGQEGARRRKGETRSRYRWRKYGKDKPSTPARQHESTMPLMLAVARELSKAASCFRNGQPTAPATHGDLFLVWPLFVSYLRQHVLFSHFHP